MINILISFDKVQSSYFLSSFLKKNNLLINGPANIIKTITNFDLCLIPVPKFPTPKPNTNI